MKTATLKTVKTVVCLSGGDLNDVVNPFQSYDEIISYFGVYSFPLLSFCAFCFNWGTLWRSWLRHCATSRKVAGSIPDGVTGIFY